MKCLEPAFCVELCSAIIPEPIRASFFPASHYQWLTAPGDGEKWFKNYNWLSINMFLFNDQDEPMLSGFPIIFGLPLKIVDTEPGPFQGEIIGKAEHETIMEFLDIEAVRIYY